MTATTPNTQLDNAIIKGVEGTTKYSPGTFTYAFARSTDAADVTAYLGTIGNPGNFVAIDSDPSDGLTDFYRATALKAFAEFSRVANLTFTASATYSAADIKITGNDMMNNASLAGRMDFPGDNPKGASATDFEAYALFDTGGFWVTLADEAGGSGFINNLVVHEFGHGVGLGHPHDDGNGTTAISTPNPPVNTDDPLDNERYTVMSYERGGLDVDFGSSFGHVAGPMALDIAALQHMYGAASTNTGDTTYTINDRGTGTLDTDGSDGSVSLARAFFSIWDSGGSGDEIVYNGTNRALINLNAATLSRTDDADTMAWIRDIKQTDTYNALPNELKTDLVDADYHAGGFFTRVFDTAGNVDLGGYSIANGAVIENAEGGQGDDVIIGNEIANVLDGFGGADLIHGGSGNDTIDGFSGDDSIFGGMGDDQIDGGIGSDTAWFSDICDNYDVTRDDATGVVTVVHSGGDMSDGTDILTNVEFIRFKNGTVDTSDDPIGCPPIDFIFLVDLSGSYSDDLPFFQAAAPSVAQIVRDIDPDSQFALASFVDLPVSPYGSPGDYLYAPELALTADIGAFSAAVGSLGIFSGNDTPEAQLVGLWRAANGVGLNLRENSQKIILIATDAPAHSASDYGLDEATILNFLETEGIVVPGEPPAPSTPPATGSGGDGGMDLVPNERGPDDPETGLDPGDPDGLDPLLDAVRDLLNSTGGTPIFASTSGAEAFYQGLTAMFGRGTTATLTFNSSNITDVVREALATITGGTTDTGGVGNDSLDGTPGPDGLFGGLGDDTINGFEGDDTLDGGGDDDTVNGGAGNDVVRGGSGNDLVDAGDGNDTIEGAFGIDTLIGGAGADVFRGIPTDLAGDTIEDFDTSDAISILGVALDSSDLEVVLGDATTPTLLNIDTNGDDIADTTITLNGDFAGLTFQLTNNGMDTQIKFQGLSIVGTPGPDPLSGGQSDDTIDGVGGVDTMEGFGGNDFYFVDDVLDQVIEAAGGGNDRVFASTSYRLQAGSEIETLSTADTTGTDPIALIGNEFANLIYGNMGDNDISGAEGADTMIGFDGDDYYLVDNAGDVVTELPGGGTLDRVFAQVSYTLTAGAEIEVMSTAFHAGTEAINLTGNELANLIFGNAGDNVLSGLAADDTLVGFEGNDTLLGGTGGDLLYGSSGDDSIEGGDGVDWLLGGAGNDTTSGGAGDDFHYVDDAGDVVMEAVGEGTDRVYATVSHSLQAGAEVETLIAFDYGVGSAAIDLAGNDLGNIIFGNNGDNVLSGGGGSDFLLGSLGADIFRFDTAPAAGDVAFLLDFTTGEDRIQLTEDAFGELSTGATLAAGAFVVGAAAGDADDRIVYDFNTGLLMFDADGNGAGAAITFAQLYGGTTLASSDFLIA